MQQIVLLPWSWPSVNKAGRPTRVSRQADTIKALFRTAEQRIKTGLLPHLNFISPNRFDALLRAILTFLDAALLLFPVLILWELHPNSLLQVKTQGRYQILVVFLFTMTFSACCSIFTMARKQEVFTATTAYSAVLVVFLGNTSSVIAVSNNAWRGLLWLETSTWGSTGCYTPFSDAGLPCVYRPAWENLIMPVAGATRGIYTMPLLASGPLHKLTLGHWSIDRKEGRHKRHGRWCLQWTRHSTYRSRKFLIL